MSTLEALSGLGEKLSAAARMAVDLARMAVGLPPAMVEHAKHALPEMARLQDLEHSSEFPDDMLQTKWPEPSPRANQLGVTDENGLILVTDEHGVLI